jgi:molybdenum cofactor cytidylyltransferase
MGSKVPSLKLGVVILGAGASSRMGQPKLLLPWGGTSVLGHLIAQWRAVGCEQITVVTRQGDQLLNEELDRLGFAKDERLVNQNPEQGMFSSIQVAAQWPGWSPALTHWAIALGDQPQIAMRSLEFLISMAGKHPSQVCQLSRSGRPKHPVLMPKSIFRLLARSKATDLKQFLKELPASNLALGESDDSGLDFDLDTPADYERVCQLFEHNETAKGRGRETIRNDS